MYQGTRAVERVARSVGAVLAMLLLVSVGCKPSDEARPASAEKPASPSATPATEPAAAPTAEAPAVPDTSGPTPDAETLLKSMVAVYQKANSYADKATLHIKATLGQQKLDNTQDLFVAFARPNKLRLEAYQGKVVCDGQDLWGFSAAASDQVLQRKAPATLTLGEVAADEMLMAALTQGPTQSFSLLPPQLVLLLAQDPLKTFLYQAQPPVLVGTKDVNGRICHGIDVARPEGKFTLWIDRQSFVLRRLEYPTEALGQGGQETSDSSMVLDFQGAELSQPIDSQAFQFEKDPAMEVVEHLTPSVVRLLGHAAPDFKFVDLEGKEITRPSLEGKIVVLDFWATWQDQCLADLPLLAKVYEEFKDNDRIAFLAVSVDDSSVENAQLKQTFESLKLSLPLRRDAENAAGKLFRIGQVPTRFLLAANGVVQSVEWGVNPNLTAELRDNLAELLAGHELHPQLAKRLEDERERYQAWLSEWLKTEVYIPEALDSQDIPKAEIAAPQETKAFALRSLWKTTELKDPGNFLVVPRGEGAPQVFVIEGGKEVVELGPDGQAVARHPLEIDATEAVSFLRTAVDNQQKRYFLASGIGQLRVHVFDENWKRISSYPQDGLQNQHPGIFDAHLVDWQDNGLLELVLGYYGPLGVQGASLEGKRLWSNRAVDTVIHIAVLEPNEQGSRSLLCTHSRGSLMRIDSHGTSQGELVVPGTIFHWITAAKLEEAAPQEICGVSALAMGVYEVVGLNLRGERLWSYALPHGIHHRPVEQIIPGHLKTSGPGQWLIPAVDGSLHVLAANGSLIDQFNYGEYLCGVATVSWNGQPVLLIASANGVEAFEVTWTNP